jgi:hypothetical protein
MRLLAVGADMSGAGRAKAKRRSLDDRIKELQARAEVVKKKKTLLDTIANAKRDLESLRKTRK